MLYSDEVTPGNPLATLNKRKFHAIYWSFLEFGLNALSREEAWFCIATEYSILVNLLSAGLSQVIAKLLMVFFLQRASILQSLVSCSILGMKASGYVLNLEECCRMGVPTSQSGIAEEIRPPSSASFA